MGRDGKCFQMGGSDMIVDVMGGADGHDSFVLLWFSARPVGLEVCLGIQLSHLGFDCFWPIYLKRDLWQASCLQRYTGLCRASVRACYSTLG